MFKLSVGGIFHRLAGPAQDEVRTRHAAHRRALRRCCGPGRHWIVHRCLAGESRSGTDCIRGLQLQRRLGFGSSIGGVQDLLPCRKFRIFPAAFPTVRGDPDSAQSEQAKRGGSRNWKSQVVGHQLVDEVRHVACQCGFGGGRGGRFWHRPRPDGRHRLRRRLNRGTGERCCWSWGRSRRARGRGGGACRRPGSDRLGDGLCASGGRTAGFDLRGRGCWGSRVGDNGFRRERVGCSRRRR